MITEMIAKNLKTFRKYSGGLSQKDFAAKMEINGKSYQAYEDGRCAPPNKFMLEYCKKFNISLEDLWTKDFAATHTEIELLKIILGNKL